MRDRDPGNRSLWWRTLEPKEETFHPYHHGGRVPLVLLIHPFIDAPRTVPNLLLNVCRGKGKRFGPPRRRRPRISESGSRSLLVVSRSSVVEPSSVPSDVSARGATTVEGPEVPDLLRPLESLGGVLLPSHPFFLCLYSDAGDILEPTHTFYSRVRDLVCARRKSLDTLGDTH